MKVKKKKILRLLFSPIILYGMERGRERECVCVCVCVRERERERE